MKTLWSQEHTDTGEVTRVTYKQVEAFLCKIAGATRREARDQMRMAIRGQIKYIAGHPYGAAFRHSSRAE